MPPSVRDWVPEGHLVWTVLDAVGELDLSMARIARMATVTGRVFVHDGDPVTSLTYTFSWNWASPREGDWFGEDYPERDPIRLRLYVEDANGLSAQTHVPVTFVQKKAIESRRGCPVGSAPAPLSDFRVPAKVFKRLENTSSSWALLLPCKSPYPCVGSITGRAKTLGKARMASKVRPSASKVRTSASRSGAPVFAGPVSVQPQTTAKLRGKLTPTGSRLLKRHGRLKVSVAVNLFTPTGTRVTTKRTATLKLPARRG